jgi:hypothetical protein
MNIVFVFCHGYCLRKETVFMIMLWEPIKVRCLWWIIGGDFSLMSDVFFAAIWSLPVAVDMVDLCSTMCCWWKVGCGDVGYSVLYSRVGFVLTEPDYSLVVLHHVSFLRLHLGWRWLYFIFNWVVTLVLPLCYCNG